MKLRGSGTLLSRNATAISQRTSIQGYQAARSDREIPDLDSTFIVVRPGLPNLGTLTLELHMDPGIAAHKSLHDAAFAYTDTGAANDDAWVLTLNDAVGVGTPTTIAFTGWVKSFQPGGMEVDGTLSGTVEITLSSVPVITARSPLS